MRVKRSLLNLFFGLGSQLIVIGLSVFIPRLILVKYSSEINGLTASITQIISYLTLLEAGVGTASVQALYKPIARDDKERINSIMAATSYYYKKTGGFYFIAVLLISVTYPFIINTEMSTLSIMTIVFLTSVGGAINYFFQGKYKILLMAEGKSYIETSIITILNIITSIIRIILLLQNVNIIVIQSSYFIMSVFQIIIFYLYIKKNYTWLNLRIEPNFKAISQRNSVMIHELSYLVFRNTDILILMIFTSLKVVSVYVMYNLFFSLIDNIVQTVNGSVKFIFGQVFHENKKNFLILYDTYEVFFMGFVFSILTVSYILILPFMQLYTSGVDDINYIDYKLAILFVIVKILTNARIPSNNIIQITGHFKNTQNRSILESGLNLFISLIFVKYLGLYGVLLGTIVAMLYRSVDMVFYSNMVLLKRSPWLTLRRWLINLLIFLNITVISQHINYNITAYLDLIWHGITLILIILPLYFLINLFFEKKVSLYSYSLLKSFVRKEGYLRN
ncbi:sugar isomerase [Paenibacillus apii]|uniref:sugar isomerase n=1 Tax=Paenibacillus apii TaxID=1850370 RepID=UPI00143BC8F2|nr:sugar isomerase [Paenibacillus apii]NJJ41644.1 sugar isomerase [Paenibacillus apii]